jgi:hypothetical protein
MSESGGYKAFRQRLDAVLRRKDPDALRAFLVSEGQWDADATTDVPAAMWMMIATSRDLTDLHAEAREWLLAHGHADEAKAIFGARPAAGGSKPAGGHPRRDGGGPGPRGGQAQRPQGPHHRHQPQQGRRPGRGDRPSGGEARPSNR